MAVETPQSLGSAGFLLCGDFLSPVDACAIDPRSRGESGGDKALDYTVFIVCVAARFLRMPFVDKLPAIAEVGVVRQEFDLNNAVETKKPQVAPQH